MLSGNSELSRLPSTALTSSCSTPSSLQADQVDTRLHHVFLGENENHQVPRTQCCTAMPVQGSLQLLCAGLQLFSLFAFFQSLARRRGSAN